MQIDINIDVESLKWNELRQTVKQCGLSTAGKKVDLQQRLKNYLKEAQHECEAAVPQKMDLTAAAETAENNGGSIVKEAAGGNVSEEAAAEDANAAAAKATTPTLTAEQRRRMEENRKRALEIRQMKEQKRLKSETATTNAAATNVITPGTAARKNPYKNPYAKASTTTPTHQQLQRNLRLLRRQQSQCPPKKLLHIHHHQVFPQSLAHGVTAA